MKFLVEYSEGGSVSVRSGWIRVLRHLGHRAEFWDPRQASAFDTFGRYEPDIFLGCSYNVDDAVEKCIRARPEMKVALFASAWGPLLDNLPPEEFPVVRASEGEIRRLERLKRETGNPHFVFIHASGQYLHDSMSGWNSVGIPYLGVLNAADVYVYGRPEFSPGLVCDACFVGGKWGYKARKIEPYIYPLGSQSITRPDYSGPLRLKIFGRNHWEFPCYLGPISTKDEADLFVSSSVCLNVSEPHSTDPRWGGDIIERVFKVMLAGGFLLSDHVPEMDAVFPRDCFVTADSPDDFMDLVLHYAEHPELRHKFIQRGQLCAWGYHTYHHRVATLMAGLGLGDEAEKSIQLLNQIRKEMQ